MSDSDDNSNLNITKLIPHSINSQISELIDGEQLSNEATTDNTSTQTAVGEDEGEQKPKFVSDKPHIGVIEEVAPEERFNKYLKTGYRINYNSWRKIIYSVFEWHNETINIWTHLVGFVTYIVIIFVIAFTSVGEDVTPENPANAFFTFLQQPSDWNMGYIKSQQSDFNVVMAEWEQYWYSQEIADGTHIVQNHRGFANSEKVSKWPIVAYLLTALFCLGCSTSCHWLSDKHKNMASIVTTLDYWGITILILGTTYPFVSYRYACGYLVVYRYIFISVLTVITLICMVVTMKPTFLRQTPKAILFISLGLFCLVPTITLYILNDTENGLKPGLAPFTWSTMFYLVGLTFYVTKFPERTSRKGRFDLLLSSHQIHHCCVLVGATIAFLESFEVYEKRLAFVCPNQEATA